jgi:hypothetical protein
MHVRCEPSLWLYCGEVVDVVAAELAKVLDEPVK